MYDLFNFHAPAGRLVRENITLLLIIHKGYGFITCCSFFKMFGSGYQLYYVAQLNLPDVFYFSV
jgi:hypothetical protein